MAHELPEVTDTTLADVAGPGSGTVVLQFSTPGCAPCRTLERVLAALRRQLPDDVRLLRVPAHENPGLVDTFAVRSVPTLVILRDGTPVDRRQGVDRPQVLRRAILAQHEQG